MKKLLLLSLLVFPLSSIAADKSKPAPKKEKPPVQETKQDSQYLTDQEFEAQLKYQRGAIVIGNGLATLSVPETFRYLDTDQSEKVLLAWGNRP